MSESEAKQSRTNPEDADGSEALAAPAKTLGKKGMAATIISIHTIQHMYANGFYVIIPVIYKQMGLIPIQAGVIDAVRWLSSGLSGIFIGFFVDMYRHRRGFFLGLSVIMVAGGYFLVSLTPAYGLILLALAFAHIGSAMWHPPGIGLLSEHFPKQRGLLIAIHRSTGSVGDTLGPIVAGSLLLVTTWQGTLQAGLPLSILFGAVLWLMLWNVGGSRPEPISFQNNFQKQWGLLKKATKGSGMIILLMVAALRGMGDRALLLFLPLYLSQVLKFSPLQVGFYLSMLSVLAIVSGPIVGAISDRVGRKPMIVTALLVSSIFPPLMVLSGTTIGLTVSIVLFGLFLYSVNSLVQAAAMDLAAGMKLEGSFIGILWGNNALFSALSPIIAGALAGIFGLKITFYYASATFLIGGLLALRLTLPKAH